jgi:hypothetical protein
MSSIPSNEDPTILRSTKTHSGLSSAGPSSNHFLNSLSASSDELKDFKDRVISNKLHAS